MAAQSPRTELIIDFNRTGSTGSRDGVAYTKDSSTMDDTEDSLRYRSSGSTNTSTMDSPDVEGFVDVSVNINLRSTFIQLLSSMFV